jgi:hypothetical protein
MSGITIFISSVTSEIFYMGAKFGPSYYGYKKRPCARANIWTKRTEMTGECRKSYNREL